MRMNEVSKEELASMDGESDRCALELSDAQGDVMGYACLVAIMSMGLGYHRVSQDRLAAVARKNGAPAPVVSSAGALVDGLNQNELPGMKFAGALVLSACVQMPSLSVVPRVEALTRKPVIMTCCGVESQPP
jgi:maleate cis-trans isomerase